MIKVEQLMKKDLACVQSGATTAAAAVIMRQRAIGSVFVERCGEIVGIVTEADIIRGVVGLHRLPERTFVEEIMSAPVIGIEDNRPIIEAADLMESNQTRHLAVTKSGAIIGVLSVRDLLHPVSLDEF